MAADALRLLFELDADGHLAVAEFKRVRAAFATELAGLKKLAASQLKSLSVPAAGRGNGSGTTVSVASLDKAATSTQKLQLQQQRLATQAQELANRQERARQSTERLAQAQERAAQQAAKTATQGFSLQKLTAQRERENQQLQRAAESLQRQRSAGIIRQLREQEKTAERTAKAFRDRFLAIGGIFENLGQSISSFGSRLSIAVTAPLAALAAVSVKSAVGLDAQVNTLKAFTGERGGRRTTPG